MKIRMSSMQPVVKKHLERVAKIKWDKMLLDPRSSVNMAWDFNYVMDVVFYAMLTGKNNLREVEDFSENYHTRIPDTTLYFLLSRINAEPIRKLIAQNVKKALRSHELPMKSFPVRITAIDGKCVSVSKQSVGNFSQESVCNGSTQYVNRVLRAAHVSNDTKLILGQREIHGKKGETTEFRSFIQSLLSLYGRTGLLEVISVDAGMNSLANANFLISNSLDYIMALKNPQKRLVDIAHEMLGTRKEWDYETKEYKNGKQIMRRLYRCEPPANKKWPHLKQFWRVQQITKLKGKELLEDRYFMTSLPCEKLNNTEVLKAIRLHWNIENNANWVFDVVWKEDDSPWCNKALVLITLLRILSYNIISRLKTRRLRKKDDRERSWKSLFLMIYTTIIKIRSGMNIKPFIHACSV